MAAEDPRVDAYIARAAEFARPVLAHLRKTVHAACPDVTETIKWGMPFFVRGDRPLAFMAAFKQHCGFGFWRGRSAASGEGNAEAMGQFGRIAALRDLPPARELKAQIVAAAARLEETTDKPPPKKTAARPKLEMPSDFVAALAQAPAARRHFDAFPPGKQRDYLEWVLEAKRESTRAQRIAQSVQWLAEGKSRNWKYESC